MKIALSLLSEMVSYSPQLLGSVSHGIAILCTIFRLVYRGWTRHLWWEDAWAAFALISDGGGFLACCLALLSKPTAAPPSCLSGMDLDPRLDTFTRLDLRNGFHLGRVVRIIVHPVTFLPHQSRAARMSIIFSIIRIADPSGDKVHKRITRVIAVSFVCMWVALVTYKINICIHYSCKMNQNMALSQLITDVVADASLILAPLQFWRNVRLSRNSKILILSAFGSSLLITMITIPHSIMLFQSITETTLIIAHVKAALSLVVCNLLVIVTLVYRVRWKETLDPDLTFGSPVIFSSVIAAQTPVNAISMVSPSVQEEINNDGRGLSKQKMEDAEERSSTEGWQDTLEDGGQ
ncbi:hypothetical protein EDB19DRAFT_1912153 [Suillus lakei]|nr:hypothetical protein EDB19DRAFT_1912153 [Suillus lakei]